MARSPRNPGCATSKRRFHSPAGTWKSSGIRSPGCTRTVRSIPLPVRWSGVMRVPAGVATRGQRPAALAPDSECPARRQPAVEEASGGDHLEPRRSGGAIEIEDRLVPDELHTGQLHGRPVRLDQHRPPACLSVDEQSAVVRHSHLFRGELVDRRAADEQETRDRGVPEHLQPALFLCEPGARRGRPSEPCVVDPARSAAVMRRLRARERVE